jgi:cyclopropane fatty-acyl-phospholipid synthase-like methyltransferase
MEWLRRMLRGQSNSIRHKYWVIPKSWVVYGAYRLQGKDWIDYYARYVDRNAQLSRNNRPSLDYLAQADRFFAFLQAQGLRPEHRFLDYGCGILRLGLCVIPYLEPSHYFGIEISRERIDKGKALLREAGIGEDRYTTHIVTDCKLREVAEQQFDFVWAQSVFTHMPLGDIREMLTALKPLLAPEGRFFFNFTERVEFERRNIKDFYYPRVAMQQVAAETGYRFAIAADWQSPSTAEVMACVTVLQTELRMPPTS